VANKPDFRQRYGPWALIAGASEGIGAAFAEQLAQAGLNLVLVARRQELLEGLATSIKQRYPVEIRTLAQDLASPAVAETLEKATSDLEVGLIVYNAAYGPIGSFFDQSEDEHRRLLSVNCLAPVLLAHRFGQRLKARGHGGIILMCSLAGFQGTPLIAHYAASKSYDLVLAEGLSAELKPYGIDVLGCVAGATLTPNYVNSNPKKNAFAPPEQKPEAVAKEALAALGKVPFVITGSQNRLASLFMRRLLPRRMALRIMAKATMEMYGPK
jgi:uncharacterized protein